MTEKIIPTTRKGERWGTTCAKGVVSDDENGRLESKEWRPSLCHLKKRRVCDGALAMIRRDLEHQVRMYERERSEKR